MVLAFRKVQKRALDIKKVPGDCELCGEWAGVLIDGVCNPCFKKYKPIKVTPLR